MPGDRTQPTATRDNTEGRDDPQAVAVPQVTGAGAKAPRDAPLCARGINLNRR